MVWAGPSGTRLLADMGAEVIKVESARSWDMLRSLHFLSGPPEQWWDKAAYFNHNNRNKYGCTLDLQSARGRELALRLVAMSDVVFENYRADVIEQVGDGLSRSEGRQPVIILVSMPSHGKSGPESHHVAYGTNVEQLSGLASLSGYPGQGPAQVADRIRRPERRRHRRGRRARRAAASRADGRGAARRGRAVGSDDGATSASSSSVPDG